MSRVDDYLVRLKDEPNWDEYLRAESGLPGPRGNLELMEAYSRLAEAESILRLANLNEARAPENTPECFLCCCGTRALGRLLAQGNKEHWPLLRTRASDPRWRVREAVAMALQHLGREDVDRYLELIHQLASGDPLEIRAALAASAEPDLLEHESIWEACLEALTSGMRWIQSNSDRKSESFKALRKGLGYGWSVLAAANPDRGTAEMERWLENVDHDLRWVMKENLRKKRLERAAPNWTQRWRRLLLS